MKKIHGKTIIPTNFNKVPSILHICTITDLLPKFLHSPRGTLPEPRVTRLSETIVHRRIDLLLDVKIKEEE